MMTLKSQYSKKVPAEQDYSSRGYAAEISVELPDNLTQEQLQQRIHNTFAMVEAAVETEINGSRVERSVPVQQIEEAPVQQLSQVASVNNPAASPSPRQLKYLTDLLRDTRHDASIFLQSRGVKTVMELSKKQVSDLISLVKDQQAA